MKNEDLKSLEQVYESINNKEKELISEDANESLGAALIYVVAFGLPFVFEKLSGMYPEIKEKLNQIKQNQSLISKFQSLIPSKKEEIKPTPDQIAPMLTGGVRKPQPRL